MLSRKTSFRCFIYNFILYLLTPFILVRLLWKSRHNTAYRHRIVERFAFIPRLQNRNRIWIHAVSVGETIAVSPLVRKMQNYFKDHAILLTTTTPTGSDTVKRLFK